jgi:branched-chain amino acid transport system substrate-binding protein
MEAKRALTFSMLAVGIGVISLGLLVSAVMAAAPAPTTIKVGEVVALTGRMAAGGKDVKAGYDLAVKHINDAGGVMVKAYGKKLPIELIVMDDESDPVKTTTRLDKLNSVDKVVAYLSGFSSDLNVVGMAAAEKNKVPWVGVTIAVEAPFNSGYKWVFAPFSMSHDQVKAFFDLLDSIPADQRPKKFGHLELNADWGIECGKYVREFAKQRGYTIVVDQKYAPASNDFASAILALKQAGAEALFSVPTPPQSLTIVKQSKELNYAAKATCLIRGPDLSTYWEAMGKDANYILSDGNWDESMPYAGNKKVVDDYRAKNPGVENIGLPIGAAYAGVQVLANAIERAGTLDRQKIRDAIAKTDMITVRGPIKFRPNGTAIIDYGLRQWQNGKNVLVWPAYAAKSKVMLAPPWDKR